MFFLIPIIIIITLIRFAIEVKPAFLVSPYSNGDMALTVVFGVGPFVVALGSYLSQYFSTKDPQRYAHYQRLGLLLPYLVFFSLIYPQSFSILMAEGSVEIRGGGWLYSALSHLTDNFELLRMPFDIIDPSASVMAYQISGYLHKVAMILVYYVVFFIYLIVCDGFMKKGSRDFRSHLPSGFMSIVRQGMFGFVFVLILIFVEGFEDIVKSELGGIAFITTSTFVKMGIAFFDASLFLLTPLLFIYFLPLILPLIAGWKVLPEGAYLDMLKRISAENKFKYNKIYLANKPGLITAGIIGYFSSTRNLVFTQDLLHLLDEKEIESVMLHEIGHARFKHIFTYYLFFLGLIFLVGVCLYVVSSYFGVSLNDSLTASVISYSLIIVGIRFGWGWLSRQCERQADLFAAEVQQTPEYLVSSFYKISDILGNVLDKPSWHHGTLRSRINYLENVFLPNSENNPKQHHGFVAKLRRYILIVFFMFFFLNLYQTYDSYSNPIGKVLFLQKEITNSLIAKNHKGLILSSEEWLLNLSYLNEKDNSEFLKELVIKKQVVVYNLACSYAVMGQNEKAFATLFSLLPLLTKELVVEEPQEKLNLHKFRTDEDFQAIKKDDRFVELLNKVDEIEKAFKEGRPNPFLETK